MMARMRLLFPLVVAAALLVPASAWAVGVREYQLQYAPTAEADGALMIVNALLDPQESLPASVTVPVPTGATLLWAGEILGGDPALDPARATTMRRVGDMDVYTLTLEQAYTAQLEVKLAPPKISGSRLTSSVKWTNPGPEALVTGSVVVEAGATDVKVTPKTSGQTQTNSAGETLYPLTGSRVAQNKSYDISANWKRPGTPASGSSPVLPILLGALVVALVVLAAVITRERTRARRSRPSSPE